MKKLCLLSLFCFAAVNAYAAPLDRSILEIRDIISSPQLRQILPPAEAIMDIRRVERGYVITTYHYQLFVEVIYGPRGVQGEEGGTPTLNFNEPTKTG
jgi:hypothetical protein